MTKISVALDGPGIELHDGESLREVHVLVQQPIFGRVLFTDNCGVLVTGKNVTIADCWLEVV